MHLISISRIIQNVVFDATYPKSVSLSRRPENKANFLHLKIIIYNTLKQTASIHNLHVVWTLSLWCLKFTSTIVVQSKTLSKRHIGAWILNGIVSELHWDHLKWFDPALNISFIKKDSFKPDLKSREAVCQPSPNWELVRSTEKAPPPLLL